MAIEDKKIPYELLVRYGLEGQPAGAHVIYRRRVVMDGEVLKDEIGTAEPIDLAGFPTNDIMTDTTRDALAEVATLTARIDELVEQVNSAADTLEKARGHTALLVAENETLIANETALQAEIAALHGQLNEARGGVIAGPATGGI